MEYIATPREVKKANYKVICKYCGKEFYANKSTAKYCSALCRQKYYKEQESPTPTKKVAKKALKVPKIQSEEWELIFEMRDKPQMSKEMFTGDLLKKKVNPGLRELFDKINFRGAANIHIKNEAYKIDYTSTTKRRAMYEVTYNKTIQIYKKVVL